MAARRPTKTGTASKPAKARRGVPVVDEKVLVAQLQQRRTDFSPSPNLVPGDMAVPREGADPDFLPSEIVLVMAHRPNPHPCLLGYADDLVVAFADNDGEIAYGRTDARLYRRVDSEAPSSSPLAAFAFDTPIPADCPPGTLVRPRAHVFFPSEYYRAPLLFGGFQEPEPSSLDEGPGSSYRLDVFLEAIHRQTRKLERVETDSQNLCLYVPSQ